MDFARLVESLQKNPKQGAALGNNCYKLRLHIKSKGKGKTGGARVLTYLQIPESSVYLLSIYDKSDKDNISDKELKKLLNEIPD